MRHAIEKKKTIEELKTNKQTNKKPVLLLVTEFRGHLLRGNRALKPHTTL